MQCVICKFVIWAFFTKDFVAQGIGVWAALSGLWDGLNAHGALLVDQRGLGSTCLVRDLMVGTGVSHCLRTFHAPPRIDTKHPKCTRR